MIKLENAGLRAPRKISLGSGLHSQKSIRAPVSKMIGLRAPQQKFQGSRAPGTPPPFGTLTNVKDRDEPNNRQGAVYKIKCSDCQASYIGETGRNLNTRLTEHKRATANGDANNHIAVHHQLTNHDIDWDSALCLTYSTNYFQRLTLESWYTNLEQTPLTDVNNYRHLTNDLSETKSKPTNGLLTDRIFLTNNRRTSNRPI